MPPAPLQRVVRSSYGRAIGQGAPPTFPSRLSLRIRAPLDNPLPCIPPRRYEAANRTVTVVIGFDSHWAADMVSLPRMMHAFRGYAVKRLFFDEGGTWKDMFRLMRTEFRPGSWGVFHLAHFTVGVGGTVRSDHFEQKQGAQSSFPGCGNFRNPMSPKDEPPCPMRWVDEGARIRPRRAGE